MLLGTGEWIWGAISGNGLATGPARCFGGVLLARMRYSPGCAEVLWAPVWDMRTEQGSVEWWPEQVLGGDASGCCRTGEGGGGHRGGFSTAGRRAFFSAHRRQSVWDRTICATGHDGKSGVLAEKASHPARGVGCGLRAGVPERPGGGATGVRAGRKPRWAAPRGGEPGGWVKNRGWRPGGLGEDPGDWVERGGVEQPGNPVCRQAWGPKKLGGGGGPTASKENCTDRKQMEATVLCMRSENGQKWGAEEVRTGSMRGSQGARSGPVRDFVRWSCSGRTPGGRTTTQKRLRCAGFGVPARNGGSGHRRQRLSDGISS